MDKKTQSESLKIRAKINDLTVGKLDETIRMELYDLVQELVKLFVLPVVSGSASDFEKDLYKLINDYSKAGLRKHVVMHKMRYVTKSVQLS